MKRSLIIIAVLVIVVIGILAFNYKNDGYSPSYADNIDNNTNKIEEAGKSSSDNSQYAEENALVFDSKFIVAHPFDLSQISAISKFRSCVGHDYSGYNAEKEIEIQRSMKHYLNGVGSVMGTNDKVKVYAPFDGKIEEILEDFASFEGKQRGKQIWLSGKSANGWVFVFFHVDLLDSIEKGTKVTAGQYIGHANLDNSPNFDITLKKLGRIGPNTLESPFLHMSSEVADQYKNKGIELEDFIIPKSARDIEPCPCSGEYCSFPSNSPENNPEDWVKTS